MSTVEGSFSCTECGKTYARQGTLARHQRNHSDGNSKKHSCTICRVSFRRKDLLNRHLRLVHQRLAEAVENDLRAQEEIHAHGRRKCHTACNACRTARSRCDGEQPCGKCKCRDSACTYTTWSRGGRTSELEDVRSPLMTPPQSQMEDDLCPEPTPDISLRAGDYPGQSDLSIVEHMSGFAGVDETAIRAGSEMDVATHEGIESLDPSFWAASTAWQWTHEGLYFKGDGTSPHDEYGQTLVDRDPLFDVPSLSEHDYAASSNFQQLQSTSFPAHGPPECPGREKLRTPVPSEHPGQPSTIHSLVSKMVDFAVCRAKQQGHTPYDITPWTSFSTDLARHVSWTGLSTHNGGTRMLLQDLIDQYFRHFHPLWPLVVNSGNLEVTAHPLLYLTLTSIGALYSGSDAAVYGSLMHKKVRSTLLRQVWRHDQGEEEALDLGRAMLLTQVAALYFEQHGAFSAAQRLGATLSIHAHRMRLFDMENRAGSNRAALKYCSHEQLVRGRKMLAFGMLRGETYMSVLFNRKPLTSYEEIDLTLPDVARCLPGPNTQALDSGVHIHAGGLLFSDLVRITLDAEEELPMLGPYDVELLIFGLQHEVWRFSHDPNLFLRLIGTRRPPRQGESEARSRTNTHDHLDCTDRRMRSLINDYQRIENALRKWRRAMSHCQLSHQTDASRTSYLSALVLYELSFLRLCAPVDAIHQIAYNLHEPGRNSSRLVSEWTASSDAAAAVGHARSIWQLLAGETRREADKQAKYNILALIALHHAAAVIWAVAGAGTQPNEFLFKDTDLLGGKEPERLMLRRENTRALMMCCAELYPKLTSAWGMQSSFSKRVQELGQYAFGGEGDR